jgi:hypothetical protein
MDIEQKNLLLNIYSYHFNNHEKELIEYSIKNKVLNFQEIIHEFKTIQNNIFNYIWEITEPDKQLSTSEIEQECAMYCFKNYQWINEVGLKALNRWLIWMCWHEGILKDNNLSDNENNRV